MDAEGWRRILASNQFGATNCDLRKTFAEVIKKLYTEVDENNTIEAFLANRLIPLDKNPGLIPIGVGGSSEKNSRKCHCFSFKRRCDENNRVIASMCRSGGRY